MMNIDLSNYQQIVILTGAGISDTAGLRTDWEPGDMWKNNHAEHAGHVDRLKDHPEHIWQRFGPWRDKIEAARPNATHEMLAKLEKNLSSQQKFTLITQNIDGLHYQAGSRNVIELNGNIHRTKCANPDCLLIPFIDQHNHRNEAPRCTYCGAPLRPDTVLSGEQIPAKRDWLAKHALQNCHLFIAIGVTDSTNPASSFARAADYAGARTININPEPMSPLNPFFEEAYLGKAEDLLPELFSVSAQKKAGHE
jgi:NAD-dependent deacetylase